MTDKAHQNTDRLNEQRQRLGEKFAFAQNLGVQAPTPFDLLSLRLEYLLTWYFADDDDGFYEFESSWLESLEEAADAAIEQHTPEERRSGLTVIETDATLLGADGEPAS